MRSIIYSIIYLYLTYAHKVTKVAIYILSYDENQLLHNLLQSIEKSNIWINEDIKLNMTIINTNKISFHHRFTYQLHHNIHVVNTLQSSLTQGFTARYYNMALLSGFNDLKNPLSDYVITIQADSSLCGGWFQAVKDAHENEGCDLVQAGTGDQLMSYNIDAVRSLGLWDERFIGTSW